MNQQTLFKLVIKAFDIGGYVKRLSNYVLNHKTYSSIKKNKKLVDEKKAVRQAYVLALGPSLKNVDLNKIDGDTIVVNRFFKIGVNFPAFVPTYYIMIDYGFAEEKNRKDFCTALDMYLKRGTIFLLNSKLKGSTLLKGYSSENIYYISCFGGNVNPNKHYRLDAILPAFQNVVGAAIMSLSTMGYKKISLLGCDFNSFASTTRIHAYKDDSSERPIRMSRELFAYSIVAIQYDDLQAYAKKHGIEIINSTKGSLIDAFPVIINEHLYF